jgi:hypothetical protein
MTLVHGVTWCHRHAQDDDDDEDKGQPQCVVME